MVAGVLSILAAPCAAAAAECPNEAFRIGPGAQLPDCRAYEQASPVDKNGGGIEASIGQVKAAEDGGGITFFSQAGIPGGTGAQEFPTFMAAREAANWSTHGLLPPQHLGNRAWIRGYTPDLRYVATEAVKSGTGPESSEEEQESAFLLEDTSTHLLEAIVPFTASSGSSPTVPHFVLVRVITSGGQLSKVFFEANIPLGSGAPSGKQNLFVWSHETDSVSPVSILPAAEGGELAPGGSFAGPYRWWENRLTAGGAFDNFYVAEEHAVSENGDRAYFTSAGSGHGQIYLRSGVTGETPSTVRVSASRKTNGTGEGGTDPFGPQPAAFLMASSDGSKAFFMSQEELTNDAYTGTEDQSYNLYLYDTSAGELVDLTPFDPAETETENGAEVQGALGISSDGSVIYFVANGVLAPGATPGSCSASPGGTCNLYRYADRNGTPTITFVARLDGRGNGRLTGDARNWSPSSVRVGTLVQLLEPTSRVSPDGETLLFSSYEPLTGYDNSGCEQFSEPGANGRCPEFYRYSAATGELLCVSCSPTGAPPTGPATLRDRLFNVFVSSGIAGTLATQTRNLSADGNQIIFETPDALVSGDVNGEGGCQFYGGNSNIPENSCQDVYEWEAQGGESCPIATAPGGCLFLISTGQSQTASTIADIDESGENVFLLTESQLVPVDRDRLVDVYDARVNGGLASQFPSPAPECVGEACQGAPASGPAVSQPGSATLFGPSNSSVTKKKKHRKKPRRSHKSCKKGSMKCKSRHHAARHNARPASVDQGDVR